MNRNTVAKSIEAERRCAFAYEIVGTMVTALVFLAVVFCFLFRVVSVDGDSMLPTLEDRERLLLTCGYSVPQHGDIVVVSRNDGEPLIKRVIACGGDSIVIRDGVVILNGEELDEPYLDSWTTTSAGIFEEETVVPENCYVVLGDNRGVSLDSRTGAIGFVSAENIMGKIICRIWPANKFGAID